MDEDENSVKVMSQFLASCGATSFCPTAMTLPEGKLTKAFKNIKSAVGTEPGAYIQGINMEGPFISEAKKGAQDEKYIIPPDFGLFERLNEICEIKIVDIAPEKDKDFKFIKEINKKNNIYNKKTVVSAAHTNADYKTAISSFESGITHVTHLFNAMNQMTSREPGLVGAVFDSENVTAELICDGIHIAPAVLRTTFKILGKDRVCVISDATMGAGLPDGEYTLGGQRVIKDTAVRLPDGTLAGSATNVFEEFKNLLSFGIDFETALRSVTINPARVIGADSMTGSIEKGKYADFIIVDENFNKIEETYVKGRKVF